MKKYRIEFEAPLPGTKETYWSLVQEIDITDMTKKDVLEAYEVLSEFHKWLSLDKERNYRLVEVTEKVILEKDEK